MTRDEIRRLIATIKHYPTCRCRRPHPPGAWWCGECEHPIRPQTPQPCPPTADANPAANDRRDM